MMIRTVTSPGGIEAWLVEDYSVPMFAMRYAFEGGSSQDPVGKEGLANFVALTLDKGAGDLASIDYRRRIEGLALRMGFVPGMDAIIGSIDALSETRDAAAQLLKLTLNNPRFDADAVEAARRLLVSFHAGKARMPASVANAQWHQVAFANHPYSRPIAGVEATTREITAADLRAYCERTFARDRLKIVAVGDITADELGKFLDEVFGDLPAKADLSPVSAISPVLGGRLRVADMEVSQSAVVFGMGAVPYDDYRHVSAYVLNQIVGGHGMASKLAKEVRIKRGLAFSAMTSLTPYRYASVFRGIVATRNEMADTTLDVIRTELQKLSEGGFSQADLENAQAYLIGTYPLRFDAHTKIAAELLHNSMSGFGPHFFESRKSLIADVRLRDLQAFAGRMLNPENLIVSIAGSPALQPPRKM
jgi:zinc protease